MTDNTNGINLDSKQSGRDLIESLSISPSYPPIINTMADFLVRTCDEISLSRNKKSHQLEFRTSSVAFSKYELFAWKRLIEEENIWPFWKHIVKFGLQPVYLFTLVNECFVKPYHDIATKRIEFDHDYIENAKSQFSDIAEACYDLKQKIACIPDADIELKEDIERFLDECELNRLLLKLMAKTTNCQWPKKDYEYCYGESELEFSELDEIKNNETYLVYQRKKPQKNSNEGDYDNAEFIKYAYKANDDYFEADENFVGTRDLFYREVHDCPPTFEPPKIKNPAKLVMGARNREGKFYRLSAINLDDFSERCGLNFDSFGIQTSTQSAIWLPIDCWLRLKFALYELSIIKIPSISSSEAAKVRSNVMLPRNCHIKHVLK